MRRKNCLEAKNVPFNKRLKGILGSQKTLFNLSILKACPLPLSGSLLKLVTKLSGPLLNLVPLLSSPFLLLVSSGCDPLLRLCTGYSIELVFHILGSSDILFLLIIICKYKQMCKYMFWAITLHMKQQLDYFLQETSVFFTKYAILK